MRLALACAFLSAAVSVIGLLLSLIVVDNAIADALQFPEGTLIEATLPGQPQSPLASSDVINAIRANANQTLLARGLLIAVFAGCLGGAAGYIIAARALGPIADVTATARRISGGSLDERIALGGARDELRDLADTFDAMLDRLDRSFDAQRRFVSNASHELRTPLSVIRTEVDVTLSDPDAPPDELRRMGEVVRDATDRAGSLVESLLALARIEAQVQNGLDNIEDVELADAVPRAVHAVGPEAEAAGVTLHPDAGAAPVRGDVHLLEQLVANLLSNAVRHNTAGGQAWVSTRTDGRWVVLSVSNTGQQLDESSVTELLRPFKRAADRTAAEGTGLGLSIVDAIVRAHQGSIALTARPEGGLEVVVRLPARTADRK
ncbi:HAMP domain-containing protein [Epidermidibacterium keratini]|uniref:histidine kinase n=1 Tax=Epidermidibacterium keratini TaxID=1891644 RepID=A0A7L4YSD5_9ACTN|nr:HAMP domain-containing sensor histidine kinase [Epidermidibacterium keratini]QHC01968.1 HAMP domain-containing protein [Epidermidibacterium keratini]